MDYDKQKSTYEHWSNSFFVFEIQDIQLGAQNQLLRIVNKINIFLQKADALK